MKANKLEDGNWRMNQHKKIMPSVVLVDEEDEYELLNWVMIR